MTLTDVLAAIVIMSLFLIGFSQSAYSALEAWRKASLEYQTARSIEFVAQSFKKECARSDHSIERWKKAVRTVRELESCEISEIWQGNILRALKATCIIDGEPVEIIGLYTP